MKKIVLSAEALSKYFTIGGGVKNITMCLSEETGGFDPAGNCTQTFFDYALYCLEGLTDYNEKSELIYQGAKSHEVSDDMTTWTFHLREEAKWNDGTPVTAADYLNTITRALNPETQSNYASSLFVVEGCEAAYKGEGSIDDIGVRAPDDHTLIFTLTAPCAYFLDLIKTPVFMPSKHDTATSANPNWDKNPAANFSNAPFHMTEYVAEQLYVFAKNENYYDADRVKLDTITYKIISDVQAKISAYKTGELDSLGGLPSYIKDEYDGKPDLTETAMKHTTFILPNINIKPLDDARVREALALAIERGKVAAILGSTYDGTTSFVAKYMVSKATGEWFSEEKPPLFTENIEEARRLLAEAGYPDGAGFPTVKLNYPADEVSANMVQAVQAQWKENLGINVELVSMEYQVCVSERRAGNFEMTRHSWTADFNDPVNYLEMYTTASQFNDIHWSNPEYDALIEASDSEADIVKRMDLLHEAEKILVTDNFCVIPIYTYTNVGLSNP
jgi:oligopeptide transport system substrate-binding protein